MYLNSFLPEGEEEYCRFHISQIPAAFAEAHRLHDIAGESGLAYAKISKAWRGLKQSGRIAYLGLCKKLAGKGYKKAELADGYFYHEERGISFTLVAGGFLAKYKRKEDLQHLEAAISEH